MNRDRLSLSPNKSIRSNVYHTDLDEVLLKKAFIFVESARRKAFNKEFYFT